MTPRGDIVRLAHSLVSMHVRFRPYGRDPLYGMDCVGVVIWIGHELGLIDRAREIPAYSFPPTKEHFEHFDEFMSPVTMINPGSVIVFTGHDGQPKHVGVVSHQRDNGIWKMIGSIPNTLTIGEFGLLPGLSDHVWKIFDYRNVEA